MKSKWTLENDVNDWVKEKLNSLKLKNIQIGMRKPL